MKRFLSLAAATAAVWIVLASGTTAAQGDEQRKPTPVPSDLDAFLSVTATPNAALDLIPRQNSTDFTFDPYQLAIPGGWLPWKSDPALSESANEQALEALVVQIDPALAADASAAIEQLVPPMIAAALAPDTPGGELIFVSVLEFGYQATLNDLQLPAATDPAQVITALGFPEARMLHGMAAGFSLEQDRDQASYVGGFALPERDRFILINGTCDPASWETYGPALTGIVESFQLSDADDVAPTPGKPTPNASGALPAGSYDLSQLPLLTPINILYQQPYHFSLPAVQTGTIDLAGLDMDPALEKIEGTDYYPPVTGYVQAAATVVFYAQPNTTVGVVFAGINYVDTVLLVRDPDGGWHFADDVKRANPDPALAVNAAAEGVYEVWVGAKIPNQMVAGDLYVIVE
ncbi:hypothetical protein [Aggregatilinea lenta]|uniref:hypothetical protein n=1 Tax=Aggregatilinea lenta TaxID=913108 RepID=UPI000E5A1984|nr:hypothetical protein [Aggregatilinea lenta]